MDKKQFVIIKKDIDSLKKLIALLLIESNVDKGSIARALEISPGRLTQILPYRKRKKD